MKQVICYLSAVIAAFLFLALQGCGQSEQFGTVNRDIEPVPLASILKKPADFNGKEVRVEGTIDTECPSGCWFEMKQDNAMLYIDVAAAGIALPQRVGKKAVVSGTVEVDGTHITLNGDGVEIR